MGIGDSSSDHSSGRDSGPFLGDMSLEELEWEEKDGIAENVEVS